MSQAAIQLAPSISTKRMPAILQIIGASLFIAICAQIRIPLFFTPVPITLQTFAILLVGSILGSKKGTLAILTYIAEALFCLPVLTGGAFGMAVFMGATGGYIFGFIAQAYLAGLYFETSMRRSSLTTLAALSGICFLQLAMGSIWLAHFVGWKSAFVMGFAPFIPGEILKSLAITSYHQRK